MKGINVGRVILGGLVAGLVVNIGETILNTVVLGDSMQEVMTRFNLPPVGGSAIGIFVLQAFLMGILMVGLYAALQPRFAASAATAVAAALLVWLLATVFGSVGMVVMGFFPAKPALIAMLWGLIELSLASLVGTRLYKEA